MLAINSVKLDSSLDQGGLQERLVNFKALSIRMKISWLRHLAFIFSSSAKDRCVYVMRTLLTFVYSAENGYMCGI